MQEAIASPARDAAGITLIDITRPARSDETRTHDLVLTFDELALIYKSLQAVKTLGALPPHDGAPADTMQLVDHALSAATRWGSRRWVGLIEPCGQLFGKRAIEGPA
jgi:hypothetical protein